MVTDILGFLGSLFSDLFTPEAFAGLNSLPSLILGFLYLVTHGVIGTLLFRTLIQKETLTLCLIWAPAVSGSLTCVNVIFI
jgi:hypothetical protein